MRAPLYLNVTLESNPPTNPTMRVSLAICRNCGKPKATSNPFGFDHLAAVMEFGRAALAGGASGATEEADK